MALNPSEPATPTIPETGVTPVTAPVTTASVHDKQIDLGGIADLNFDVASGQAIAEVESVHQLFGFLNLKLAASASFDAEAATHKIFQAINAKAPGSLQGLIGKLETLAADAVAKI